MIQGMLLEWNWYALAKFSSNVAPLLKSSVMPLFKVRDGEEKDFILKFYAEEMRGEIRRGATKAGAKLF
jgi:hypothetical protein